MNTDPRDIIDREPMSGLQIFAVGICIFLNALDGFDVLAITFAAPGIAEDWGLGADAIGIVLLTGLAGMAAGSLFLAPLADRFGRRAAILGSLVTMGVGMLLSATAMDIITMSVYRVITGLGIGAMLASINAMAAEYSNAKRRDFAVSLMTIGYPVGGVLGGSVAVVLLQHYSWHSVFVFGGLVTLAIIPLVLLFLPESIEFLSHSKGAAALDKINKILRRMKHQPADHIAEPHAEEARAGFKELFATGQRNKTLALAFSYFLHITTFYYVLGWVPYIVTELGFDKAVGTSVSVWVNIGGIIGGSILGWVATFFGMRKLVIGIMLATAAAVIAFGQVTPQIELLKLVGFILGCFVFGGVVGLYALIAKNFPTKLRASGTGFVIGMGRGGSLISPALTGYLFALGMDRGGVAIIMAMGSIIAAVALIFAKQLQDDVQAEK
ncbi:MFS transporter [Emcibacter nanhaiensis]|uniref:MFS transporter n=1 Tax=Emcibacter nanhaiensis TaxID=1505037 RepID=A0A501PF89_9PROT|nr:MFS transporter [Emcibacter nanhaiensis]TPD59083.1 MFS transporter [Emcibacter nanhaiensis]